MSRYSPSDVVFNDDWLGVPETDRPVHGAEATTVAVFLLFGSIVFAFVGTAAKAFLLGEFGRLWRASGGASGAARPLEPTSFASVFSLLYHGSVLGLFLFGSYVIEHHPVYPHADRSAFDADECAFLLLTMCLVASRTIKRNDGREEATTDNEKKTQEETRDGATNNHHQNHNNNGLDNDDDDGKTAATNAALRDVLLDDDVLLDAAAASPANSTLTHLLPNHHSRTTAAVTTRSSYHDRLRPVVAEPCNPCDDLLSPHQTREWKGLLTVLFLVHRVSNAASLESLAGGAVEAEVDRRDPAINVSRILQTAFLWINAYSHFSYFSRRRDHGVVRLARILWRYNALCVCLCLTHRNPWLVYHACPLVSYYFVGVYAIARARARLSPKDRYGLRLRLVAVAVGIYCVWDTDVGLFRLLHLPFTASGPASEGAASGPLWEWYFRTSLDHWTAFFGVVFAANAPAASLLLRRLEAQRTPFRRLAGKALVGTALTAAAAVWAAGPLRTTVLEYDATHPYFGVLPIIAYVFWRNATPTLRSRHVGLFHAVGGCSLEAYLLSFHLLMIDDGRKMYTVLPGYPRMNLLLVFLYYTATAYQIHKTVAALSVVLLPDDPRRCGRSLGVLSVVVAGLAASARALEMLGALTTGTVAVVVVVCGVLLYQTVTDLTWDRFREEGRPKTPEPKVVRNDRHRYVNDPPPIVVHREEESAVARASPPLIATLVVVTIGLSWHTLATIGAGRIQPLPADCAAHVNAGRWLAVDGANDYARGAAERERETSLYGAQDVGVGFGAPLTWGWDRTESRALCRFASRSPEDLANKLRGRTLVFVGDSVLRNLFHAVCRAMGDADAGRFDATVPRHSDVSKEFGRDADTVRLEYRWAPLAVDQLEKLRDYNHKHNDNDRVDLLVLGGGAWDRLHVWATDEDQESLKHTVERLAKAMNDLRTKTPVVWTVPTTVHTPALQHEEKRAQMSEAGLEEMRRLYAGLGVLAASDLVVDGPAFTRDRVEESFDGVHYPPRVYDAGAQILANALDWLSLSWERRSEDREEEEKPFDPPEPGTLANPSLGLVMFCLAVIGLFFFDGFLGFSYLASVVADGVMPNDLYEETRRDHDKGKYYHDDDDEHVYRKVPTSTSTSDDLLRRHGNHGTTTTTTTTTTNVEEGEINRMEDVELNFAGDGKGSDMNLTVEMHAK